MAGFSYQFTGFEHGHVEIYTKTHGGDENFSTLVGSYYPVDNEVHNLSLSSLPYDHHIKLKYVADDGYYWKAGSKVYYGGGDNYVDAWSFKIPNDTTSTPKMRDMDADSTVFMPLKFTAKSSPVPRATSVFSYTQNLSNCTSDYSNNIISQGEHTITLTASDKHFFTEKGTISINGVASDITPSGGTTQVITFNATGDVVITMTAIQNVTYKITQKLTHCTSSYHDSTISQGEHTITLTANDGYIFSKNGRVNVGTTIKTITASGTNTQQVTFNATGNVTITMEAMEETPPEPPTPTVYTITQNLTNCTSDYSADTIEEGPHTITLTATAGYVFNEAGRITIGTSFTDITPSGTNTQVIEFRASNNIIINMKANKQVEQLSSFNRLYHVTNSELMSLSKIRYYTSNNTRGDYGEYITNLYEIPFDISNMLSEPANIVLGWFATNIPAQQIDGYKLELDLGNIICTMPYNNSYDYLNTKATLYIPYFGPIEIDSNSCINRTISIKLFVDLYSGYGTLKVMNDFDEILANATNIVVNKIPFVQEKSGILLRQDVLKFTDIFTPYIVVTNPIPYIKNSSFGYSDNANKVLNTCNGFVRADNIKFTTLATSLEISEIETLLNKGIYIR